MFQQLHTISQRCKDTSVVDTLREILTSLPLTMILLSSVSLCNRGHRVCDVFATQGCADKLQRIDHIMPFGISGGS